MVIGEFKSDWLEVLSGVPQGSCLGPLLFVLFINDMPNLLENVCKLFADDTKPIGTIKNSLDLKSIQSDVDKLEKWAKDWLMSFNEPKCKYMVFNGNKNLPITLNLNNKPMMKTDMERDLGIHITSDLKWNFQASNAATQEKSRKKRVEMVSEMHMATNGSAKNFVDHLNGIGETNAPNATTLRKMKSQVNNKDMISTDWIQNVHHVIDAQVELIRCSKFNGYVRSFETGEYFKLILQMEANEF